MDVHDVHDVDRMAGFWSAVLGYRIERGDGGDAHLWPPSGGLSVWLQPSDQPRTTKNCNHPDLMVAGDRIIDAALDVIAERGVAGTTHREIARAADVPLGSMTYHFTSLDEVLTEAFTRHADTAARVFDERLRAARDRDEAIEAVVTLISDDLINPGSDRDLILAVELYGAAARNPALRVVTQAWMARSRRALERHFDTTTARETGRLHRRPRPAQHVVHRPDDQAPDPRRRPPAHALTCRWTVRATC